jgi:hypothetical protein
MSASTARGLVAIAKWATIGKTDVPSTIGTRREPNMRLAAPLIALGFCVAAAVPALAMGPVPSAATRTVAPSATLVEYYCSPGFEPTYGGRCVATLSRDEIDLYLNDTTDDGVAHHRYRRHHRRHYTLHSRY